jgi:hypothetical protein
MLLMTFPSCLHHVPRNCRLSLVCNLWQRRLRISSSSTSSPFFLFACLHLKSRPRHRYSVVCTFVVFSSRVNCRSENARSISQAQKKKYTHDLDLRRQKSNRISRRATCEFHCIRQNVLQVHLRSWGMARSVLLVRCSCFRSCYYMRFFMCYGCRTRYITCLFRSPWFLVVSVPSYGIELALKSEFSPVTCTHSRSYAYTDKKSSPFSSGSFLSVL